MRNDWVLEYAKIFIEIEGKLIFNIYFLLLFIEYLKMIMFLYNRKFYDSEFCKKIVN